MESNCCCGASTFTNLIMNSFYFGAMMAFAEDSLIVVLLVIPHDIFEIPAIIIAGAAGFKIPYEIVRYLAGRKE
ncbi:stage II sporulation protein M [Ferroglobus sp.]|uniref:stage II sporulation protein M n=1 Tax=Ferroglobus sp. TaxID=2614230 RepID=UPI0025C32DE6|nr:stage II sporulation protein M [Ferroglobus sp.]